MSGLLRVLIGSGRRTKPAPPTNTQVIACPPGYIGPGQTQVRNVVWDIPSQSWQVGPWVTSVFGCQLAVMSFRTPVVRFNPRRSGKMIQEGLQQLYGPYTVSDEQGYGYQMTLEHLVICPDSSSRRSRLTIQLYGTGVAGAYVVPTWDRDYAYFPPQYADPTGRCYWDVPNGEWTDNASTTTVSVTLQ